MTTASAVSLAATGSDIAPWLIGAGIIIVLGAIVLIIAQVVRSRRASALAAAGAGVGAGTSTAAGAGGAAAAAGSGETPAAPADGTGPSDPISPDDSR